MMIQTYEDLIKALNKSNSSANECSGCGKFCLTVDPDMFYGMCTKCSDRGLFDPEFVERIKNIHEKLNNR